MLDQINCSHFIASDYSRLLLLQGPGGAGAWQQKNLAEFDLTRQPQLASSAGLLQQSMGRVSMWPVGRKIRCVVGLTF